MCSLILKMPWPLGSFQLYAQPRFWRMWDPKWNLVSGWEEHDGIPRKHILCPVRWCNRWALLFVSYTTQPPPNIWSDKRVFGFLETRIEFTTGVEPPTHIWDQVPNSVIFVVVLIVLVAKLVTHSGGQVCNFCIYSERQLWDIPF